MASDARKNPWSTFVWGTLILAAGLILWLDRLGRLEARDWFEWWPVALFAGALAELGRRRWIGALIWAGLGTYFLMDKLGYEVPRLREVIGLWPLLISAAGLTLIVHTLRAGGDPSRFRAFAVMAGNQVSVGSEAFRGGQAVAVMGGCEIDLDSARTVSGDATIDVLAFWGGIEIRVPRGWRVVDRVAPILGGFEDRTGGALPDGPRLVVRGTAIMGGVEVKNQKESHARPIGGHD